MMHKLYSLHIQLSTLLNFFCTVEKLENLYREEIKPVITNKEQLRDPENKQLQILIQTVNNFEFYAAMVQCNKVCGVSRYNVNDPSNPNDKTSYYFVGKWGEKKVPVAIVQTEMGGDGTFGSYNATLKALKCLPNLKYIFAVGVCGGFKGKVNLGEVIVSQVLQDYSLVKMKDGKMTIRSTAFAFTENEFYHFISRAGNKPPNITCGLVLSANILVADAVYQKLLLDACPDAIALEMEGHGIARACQGAKVEILIVKGVSDLADKLKDDSWQPQAAMNAAKVLCQALEDFGEINYLW